MTSTAGFNNQSLPCRLYRVCVCARTVSKIKLCVLICVKQIA